ncbi:hypothetical protein ACFVYR_06450 [Streptomyces sp. NPDC058284]|uniref:hypothetical protein n=1 Tax=unclassified Streptomyces TaxID=2593676 RepID=UPI00365E0794
MDQQNPRASEPENPEEPMNSVCGLCGTVARGTPPTWTCSVENGTRRYLCEACARDNIRAIEGRLDSAWW